MAGIGFELRKLFADKSMIGRIKASIYSTLVVSGPMIICVSTITILQLLFAALGVSSSEIQLFIAAVTYSCIFSILVTSGISIIVTRYVSDLLYEKKTQDILASMYGALSICFLLGAIIGGVFYLITELDIRFELAAYYLFLSMIGIWTVSVYLSALKKYKRILAGFSIGGLLIIASELVLSGIADFNNAFGLLLAMDIGFYAILVIFLLSVKEQFKVCSSNVLSFTAYFEKYPKLFLSYLFFSLGLNIHNIIFWFSEMGVVVGNTYRLAPVYDIPTYYAFFSTIPCMVLFVVRFETSFLEAYKGYYNAVNIGGRWCDIQKAKAHMFNVLKEEIKLLAGIQFTISLGFLLVGLKALPFLNLEENSMSIFAYQIFGCYINAMLLVFLHIHYYFSDYKGALFIAGVFLGTNALFTYLSLIWGQDFYGIGLLLSSSAGLVTAFARLNFFLKRLDYYTYCLQPVYMEEKYGLLYSFLKRSEKIFL